MAMIHLRGAAAREWYNLEIDGASDLINRISRFDKDVYKVLQREVREVAQDMRTDAQRLEPTGAALSNWGGWIATRDGRDLGFSDAAGLNDSMKVSVRKQTRYGVVGVVGKVIAPRNPAAAIFLLAGKKTPGSKFNRELIARYGSTYPRGMTEAWRRGYAKAAERIDAAIDRARASIVG